MGHPRCGEGQNPIGRVGHPRWHTSMAKKLRYMSKIAAIFARTDNTPLSYTQPIWNLLVACS